ncbi:MAG TPA: hypothetical protein VGR69_09840 [Candidatus Rubrimentiphilum sp.]|nr:hypothetical protein [Candidatus Rubrimentiphilum sp.]
MHSGAFHVVVQSTGTSVGVAFGGTPAILKASANPGSFTDGTPSNSVVRVLAYDALGNRLIGAIAFPSPITMTSSDTSGKMTLSGSTITAPGDTLTLNYTGAEPRVRFSRHRRQSAHR